MPQVSSPELQVLVALRLRSLAEVGALAGASGLPAEQVQSIIDTLAVRGSVRYREGRLHGWALTPAGRRLTHDELRDELASSGRAEELQEIYREFLALNPTLLELCTDWQLREVAGEQVVNLHDDPAYDDDCRTRLVALDREAQPVVGRAADLFVRFGGYPHRLSTALARVRAGDDEYFTSPGCDSYHTVWFELHEHLLASLDRERSAEREGVAH